MSRNYRKERDDYHSKPEQMVRNAARKRARRWMEKEGKAKAGDGKDVHHKDNNPLNNDKNNLSLVTQHYNRKEPRLRAQKEDAISRAKEKVALKKKHDAEKEAEKAAVKRASEDTQEANAVSMSNPDAKLMIGMMQKYIATKNPNLKMALMKKINKLQAKLGLKVTEDMGTVTGPHIVGTGDDSSTVVVKKKKKKKVYRRESLKKRVIDHVLAIQQKV